MTNKAIARVLKETASLIELNGGNPFRARAFQRAARTLDQMEEAVTDMLEQGILTDIRGIGSGLAAQIEELIATGTFTLREELQASLPPDLPDLLRVKGLGSKKVRQLWQVLGITSLDELEQAAQIGRIAELDGFGEKTQENILANLQLLKTYRQRWRYADAVALVMPVVEHLRSSDSVQRAELAGELRRNLETVTQAEMVVASNTPEDVQHTLPDVLTDQQDDENESTLNGTLPEGLPLRVHVVPPDRFGTALWIHTGADDHLTAFRSQYGAPAPHSDEAQIYADVGLSFVEPELREGDNELAAAAEGTLPDLITTDDLRGTLHNHSTYSDGAHSLRQMTEAARALGFDYFGICDHSQSLQIASGLSIDRVRAQQEEIAQLNEEFAQDDGSPFRIVSGIESDILADGSLDYPDDVLASFDLIVASVHTGFSMTADEATERIIRAVENPYTTILGHPTGRLLLRREGYPIHHERIIDACAEHGVAIECNANPYRLDLDWRWIRAATRQGVLISINPDAHATDQLEYMRWGVAVARKGWLTADQCLNAKPLDAFTTWLEQRRATRVAP